MKYYFSFLRSKQFNKMPVRILLRALNLLFLVIFNISKEIKYSFGAKVVKFKFIPLKRHMGGRGIYLYEENIEPLLKYGHYLIKKGDNIIDGGANQGIFSLAFGKKVGRTGTIFAVEPFKYCIKQIKHNSKINNLKNIKTIQCCLYNREKTTQIDYSQGIGSASIVRNFGTKKKYVRTIQLDTLKKKNSLKAINFIKLDIEGAELFALQGAKMILEKDKPTLSVECEKKDFIKVNFFLNKYGYVPFLFDENGILRRVYKIYKKEACVIFINKNNLNYKFV